MSETAQLKPAQLLLEDGTLLNGFACGKEGTAVGEICFDTGMTGYQEMITNPSYTGQVVVMNNCYVGNYGVLKEDAESDGIKAKGLVCKKFTSDFSRHAADGSLQDYLSNANVVGISDIDTRALVKHIRDNGTMSCVISSEGLSKEELNVKLKELSSIDGLELASTVSTKKPYEVGNPDADIKVAVLDLGVRNDFLNALTQRGAFLKVFPAKTSFKEMETFNPNGYFLSNGPGDPNATTYAVDTLKDILNANKPIFGIGLGHQILALANGAEVTKLPHGHRGLNHPVIRSKTKKSEITTQNHGFSVNADNLNEENIEVTHLNLNDDTVEGIKIKGKDAFSVQYYPVSKDSFYLYDDFISALKK